MSRLKILHLLSQRPEGTGSGYYLQNILRQAEKAGHLNYLVAGIPAGTTPKLDCIAETSCSFVTFSGGNLDYPVPGMSDVMPYESSIFGSLSTHEIGLYEEAFSEKIEEVVRTFSPDIIHSHHLWIASAVARITHPGIPMVTSCHSTDLRQFVLCPDLGQRVRAGCQKIERILALSRDQVERIVHLYGIDHKRIDIVGGGFNDALFRWSEKDEAEPVHLLYAGKLSLAKGVDWLLRTFSGLVHLPVHLHLAGSGTGKEERLCLELAHKMSERVTVYGRVSQEKLASLMRKCHIFVLPSFFEGLPLVLLEALASGCRIVTTNLPGACELLGDGRPDMVEFVSLPEMDKVDRPNPQDWDHLMVALQRALTVMVERSCKKPSVDNTEVQQLVNTHGWPAVFKRIESSYLRALKG